MLAKNAYLNRTVLFFKPSEVALHEFPGGCLRRIKELFLQGDVPWAEHKCYDYLKRAWEVSGGCVLVDRKPSVKTQSLKTDICACEFLWFSLISCGRYHQSQWTGHDSKTFIQSYTYGELFDQNMCSKLST